MTTAVRTISCRCAVRILRAVIIVLAASFVAVPATLPGNDGSTPSVERTTSQSSEECPPELELRATQSGPDQPLQWVCSNEDGSVTARPVDCPESHPNRHTDKNGELLSCYSWF
ncbi:MULTISPECIES: hypothetical protein [unclassified Pseudonocardia]|uniref:hypothetical protein n=1 Tax=unclassified Pseudonocardia TaxID=2619320 RepID=UPI0011153A5C|nr:hypothetical protein [Pseudonocardia sp. Ae707_Ps1]